MRGAAGKRPALGVRDRTGQAAFLRSARAGPSTQVGWRQVKFLVKFFSKNLQGVGRSLPVANALRRPNRQVRPASHGPKGGAGPLRPGGTLPSGRPSRQARPVGPAFPYFQKRRGRMSPSWDSTKAVAPWLERGKCTSEPKIQCLCGFRHLHLCTREKYRASENRFHLYIGTNEKT